jgi:hypothetical protein
MRRSSLLGSFVLLLASLLLAQQSPITPKNGMISGLIIDSTNSTPVKHATVRLIPVGQAGFENDQRISAVADDQGHFTFKDVPAGNYELHAEHPGFAAFRRPQLRIRLNAGQTLNDVVLRLTPAAVITGHVVNEQGEPMPGVGVQALRYTYSPAGRRLVPAGGASTDDQGEYRMFALPPGRYYVRAKLSMSDDAITGSVVSSSKPAATPAMRYPATYYPGVGSVEEASPVELRPADQASIDFNLAPVKGVYIRGRLPGGANTALGTAVLLFDDEGIQSESLAQNGAFELRGVLPGTYTLMAQEVRSDGKRGLQLTKAIQVGQADLNNVELEESASAISSAIHGQVRVAGDSRPDLSQLMVMLQPAEAKQQGSATGFATGLGTDRNTAMPGLGMVQKNGSFLMGMPADGPGVYFTMVAARGPGLESFYSKSVIYGGKEITETGLTLPTSPATLEIVIAADGATVQGSVVNAKNEPVDGATVIAIPANPKLRRWAELYQPATTDENGQFTIQGLRPGEYQVYAWQDIDSYTFLDPDFMRGYEDRGRELKAEANGRYTLVLPVLDAQPPEP